jgi:hypothetical protein
MLNSDIDSYPPRTNGALVDLIDPALSHCGA